MPWRVELTPKARRQFDRLDSTVRQRIGRFLSERVANGDPVTLSAPLSGGDAQETLRRFRVGDYRVIAVLETDVLRVLVVDIGHRGEVYRRLQGGRGPRR